MTDNSQTKDAVDHDPLDEDPLLEDSAGEPTEPPVPQSAADPTTDPASDNHAPPLKARGRGLAWLALLVALAAVGGATYLYYELIYLNPLAQIAQQTNASTSRYETLQQQLTTSISVLEQRTDEALAQTAQEQLARIEANEKAVVSSLNEALNAAPPSQREWKLAEAEYLMRIANHRVLMEQDSDGALVLLNAADAIMAELDDFALHQVRARLADEILALQQVPRQDLQGLYLRLEALKLRLDELPVAAPSLQLRPTQGEAVESIWQQLGASLKDYVRLRSVAGEQPLKPLLTPDEERYLQLNLRLAFEQAQLAVLKRQQAVFQHSLQSAGDWISQHYDTDMQATQLVLDELAQLDATELALPLPDVSGSLNELLAVRRGLAP